MSGPAFGQSEGVEVEVPAPLVSQFLFLRDVLATYAASGQRPESAWLLSERCLTRLGPFRPMAEKVMRQPCQMQQDPVVLLGPVNCAGKTKSFWNKLGLIAPGTKPQARPMTPLKFFLSNDSFTPDDLAELDKLTATNPPALLSATPRTLCLNPDAPIPGFQERVLVCATGPA